MKDLHRVTGFSLEVRSEREFNQAWEALRDVFPVAAAEYESKYQQNQVSGRGYIKWAPDEGQMWTSVTKVWHEFMLEFKDYEDLRAHLSASGIFLAKAPCTELVCTDFDEFLDVQPVPAKATTRDALRFVELVCKYDTISKEVLELQGQAQEKLEVLDAVVQEKEALRVLLNIEAGE